MKQTLLMSEELTAKKLLLDDEDQKYNIDEHPLDLSRRGSLPPYHSKKQNVYIIDLIRVCVLSILLGVGYALNLTSVSHSITTKKQKMQLRIIIYLLSTCALFVLCLIMICMTLCGFRKYKQKKILLSISLFISVIGHSFSLVLGLLFDEDNDYIHWQFELLYSLLPLYIIFLIIFFGGSSARIKMAKLIIFSFILFIGPCLRLGIIVNFPAFSIQSPIPSELMSAYIATCFATFILVLFHVICFLMHYDSGLLMKLIILILLFYSNIILIKKKIDFDLYIDRYRIHYYYSLLTGLYVMLACELFIKPPANIIKSNIIREHMINRESFSINMARMKKDSLFLSRSTTTKAGGGNTTIQSTRGVNGLFSSISTIASDLSLNGVNGVSTGPYKNPNDKIQSVIKIFPDFKPIKKNKDKYFDQIKIDPYASDYDMQRKKDSIACIVPFYNEGASELHATLRSLFHNFEYIKQRKTEYQFTHFNVLLVGDGWFKAHKTAKQYLTKLYNVTTDINQEFESIFKDKNNKHKHNTVILQTKGNKPLCINPFNNGEDNMMMKVTTIIKIDNRKKANSHEWFLGEHGFADWTKCDYMYFTDAYSTINQEGLFKMVQHMKEPKNKDVVCCTGRARVYTIEQELKFKHLYQNKVRKTHKNVHNNYTQMGQTEEKHEIYSGNQTYTHVHDEKTVSDSVHKWWKFEIFKDKIVDNFEPENEEEESSALDENGEKIVYNIEDGGIDQRLSINAHLRDCQMFEFEALYGTIGCYLLGGFLPVIPGPCGFYRSKYLLKNKVRGWYFKIINEKNDPDNMDLVLGNMKLAEDRILTITSILNCDESVRHSLIPDCIFYFDPMQDLNSLMKQRRRWINGSIATIIFVLQKVPFSQWKVNFIRRYYVLCVWYMQLYMFVVLFLSPPLLFIISYQYGLAAILQQVLIKHWGEDKQHKINVWCSLLSAMSWIIYLFFIYFAQVADKRRGEPHKCKHSLKPYTIKIMLFISYSFGILTMTGLILQFVTLFRGILNPDFMITHSFAFIVALMGVLFFLQTFIMAPLFSKDITTLKILSKKFLQYFIYSPFYVIFFFINAICNVHDLSWGTRPDNPTENNNSNPKHTTFKIISVLLVFNIIMAIAVQPFSESRIPYIIIFLLLMLPSIFQVFFAIIWLAKTRFMELIDLCLPKRIDDQYKYVRFRSSEVRIN